tara:strand:- start:498 stop:728 length:231 start_codon:yes stop_codon:yes gene_type:complete
MTLAINKGANMANKSYPLNSTQKWGKRKGKVIKKKCYQCNHQSVIRHKDGFGDWSSQCLNGCGPEELSNLLNFGGR